MIGEKIRFVRNNLNMNQKEFAKSLNVAQSTISRVENGDRQPEYDLLKNIIDKFNVNPNWIFFDKLPQIYSHDEIDFTQSSNLLLADISNLLTPKEFNDELNKILINKSIDTISQDSNDKSLLRKFFEIIKLDDHIPFRPLMFLYYIFRYTKDNKEEIYELKNQKQEEPYKQYLLDLVQRYNVLSFKNNPMFTSEIKKKFIDSITLFLTEEECKRLLTYNEDVIIKIESKMPPGIVYAHRKIDTKALFPKK
ncbi:helix-turn-helix transcriptional regulator [Aliarcobacter skirrowii]|uniref:helix-turn-helix domain-containing protein n=1 Tax=Aliarcobacter skirrowii TaxID=28200 RepID=UPI0029B93119|nr:helix-turn-helix transcriptional regulator [Aliarcobacter skirrowii]MDX4057365.1 helix-turn-helix transcriptional regulator [Aliarcobacter skirrowii]